MYKGKGKAIRFLVLYPPKSSQACTHGKYFNHLGDIPEQLAAYSAHALSTALFILGIHFTAG